MDKLKVLYNAYTLSKPITGVGRYTQLLSFINSDQVDKYASIPNEKIVWENSFTKVFTKNYNTLLGKIYWNLFDLYPNYICFDLLHSPYPSLPIKVDIPSIVTIHDLLFLSNPEWYPKLEIFLLYRALKNSITRANKIICVSNYTLQMLISYFPEVKYKCIVIHNSFPPPSKISKYLSTDIQDINNNNVNLLIKSGNPYFICPSNRHPRKNLLNTINGFIKSKYNRIGYKLILTGLDESYHQIENNSTNVLDFGYLEDTDYYALIKNSSGILYFPFNEGFGLPILDSLIFNKFVFCSDIPVFNEIITNHNFLCTDFKTENGIANFLNKISESDFIKDDLVSNFIKDDSNFSFSKFESRHLELYTELLHDSKKK